MENIDYIEERKKIYRSICERLIQAGCNIGFEGGDDFQHLIFKDGEESIRLELNNGILNNILVSKKEGKLSKLVLEFLNKKGLNIELIECEERTKRLFNIEAYLPVSYYFMYKYRQIK